MVQDARTIKRGPDQFLRSLLTERTRRRAAIATEARGRVVWPRQNWRRAGDLVVEGGIARSVGKRSGIGRGSCSIVSLSIRPVGASGGAGCSAQVSGTLLTSERLVVGGGGGRANRACAWRGFLRQSARFGLVRHDVVCVCGKVGVFWRVSTNQIRLLRRLQGRSMCSKQRNDSSSGSSGNNSSRHGCRARKARLVRMCGCWTDSYCMNGMGLRIEWTDLDLDLDMPLGAYRLLLPRYNNIMKGSGCLWPRSEV
jgi:hypothetical protein